MMADTPKMRPGTFYCILCQGIVTYKNGDTKRFNDHMNIEHGAFHNMRYLLAGCLMAVEERNIVAEIIEEREKAEAVKVDKAKDEVVLKRDPVWLECLQTPDVSANLLLLGGDGQQVVVPAPLLLAASPVVRSILTDHLPTAYSPWCLSLPAITGDVLQIFGDILATGAAVGAHEDKIEEVRQVFEMLGVEARIVSSHLESIQVGQVLDRDITKESFTEVSGIGLDEENTCKLEINVKIESKENIVVKVESEEFESFEIGEPYKQNMTNKSSLIIQQSPSSTTSEKSGNLKNNVNLSEPKKRKKSTLGPILSHNTHKKAKQPTTCKSTAIPVRIQSLVPDVLRVAPITHQRTPRNPPSAFKVSESNGDKPLTSKPKSPGSLKK